MDSSVVLVEAAELQKMKQELQEARNEVSRVNQEMHSQHMARSTMEHLSQSSDADYSYAGDITEQTLANLQNKFNASTRTNYGWGSEPARPAYTGSNSFGPPYQTQARPQPAQSNYRRNGFLNEPTHFSLDQSFRTSGMNNSFTNGMGNGMANCIPNSMNNSFSSGMGMSSGISNPPSRPSSAFEPAYPQYGMPPLYPVGHLAPIGTMGSRLSPDAHEFNVPNGMAPSPWNSQVSTFSKF
jgi:hypothetical protein